MIQTLLMLIASIVSSGSASRSWTQLPPIPDAAGVAGCFAGVSGGALIVAGGANFPDKKPWDGGQKVWHDTIFALERPGGQWKIAGKLPRPLAYGVSVTHGNLLVCVGGADLQRHYSDVFALEWTSRGIVRKDLPSLPIALADACGAMVGDTLYIAGGRTSPTAAEGLNKVFAIDLKSNDSKWQKIEAFPGAGRILSLAASCDGAFWIVGGAELAMGKSGNVERRYLTDAYRYDPSTGWHRSADLPRPAVGVPSPAPSDPSGFFLLGGDDGSEAALPAERRRGFNRNILRFDRTTKSWLPAGDLPAAPVTTPLVQWNGSWIIPSGEIRPGIRSPQVWSFTPTVAK